MALTKGLLSLPIAAAHIDGLPRQHIHDAVVELSSLTRLNGFVPQGAADLTECLHRAAVFDQEARHLECLTQERDFVNQFRDTANGIGDFARELGKRTYALLKHLEHLFNGRCELDERRV